MAFWNRLFHKKEAAGSMEGREDEKLHELEEDPDEEESVNGFFEEDKKEVSSEGSEEEEYEVVEREIHPAKIICPECGGITLEGLEFCDKCGGELQ